MEARLTRASSRQKKEEKAQQPVAEAAPASEDKTKGAALLEGRVTLLRLRCLLLASYEEPFTSQILWRTRR